MENGEKILLETQQKVTIQRTVDIYKQYRKELGLTQSENVPVSLSRTSPVLRAEITTPVWNSW